MAATTLEKLVVELVGENSDLKAKLKESENAAKKSTDGISGAFKSLKGSVNEIMASFTSFQGLVAAAGVAAFASYTAKVFEAADGIGKLSQTTGFGTKAIQELTFAASQSNVEAQALNQGLSVFSRTVGDAAMGGEQAQKAFRALGVSVLDANGNLKPNEALLSEVSDALARTTSAAERASLAQDLFGRGGQQLLPLLSQGSKGMNELARKANELGIVLDDKLIQSADETNDKLSAMKQVVQAQLSRALLELAPVIQFVTAEIVKMTESTIWLIQQGGKLYDWTKQMLGIAPAHAESIAKIGAESQKTAQGLDAKTLALERATRAQRAHNEAVTEKAQKLVDDSKNSNKGAQLQKEIALIQEAEDRKLQIKGDTQAAIIARQEELNLWVEEQNAKEIEALMAKNETMRALDDQKYAADIAANEAFIASTLAANTVSAAKQEEIRLKIAAQERKHNEQKMQQFQGTMGFISQLQHSKSKEMAAIGKAAAIAQATVNTYVAANNALASVPWPFNFVAAGAVIATGLMNVSNIAGVDIGLNRGADRVPGVGTGDSVRAMLTPGERVVPRSTNAILEEFLLDYRAMKSRDVTPMGGADARIEIVFRPDEFMDWLEVQQAKRGRLSTAVAA